MDEPLMFTWFAQIWKTYADEKQEQLCFNRSLMVYDAFKAHTTDDMKVLLATNSLQMVPAGCTSNCQPLDVCINKPFKAVLVIVGKIMLLIL